MKFLQRYFTFISPEGGVKILVLKNAEICWIWPNFNLADKSFWDLATVV
jgi:hypothetical protein